MWYSATINAFDVMGDVHVSAQVRARGDSHEDPVLTVRGYTTTVPGSGETDPAVWLRDALLALAETL